MNLHLWLCAVSARFAPSELRGLTFAAQMQAWRRSKAQRHYWRQR